MKYRSTFIVVLLTCLLITGVTMAEELLFWVGWNTHHPWVKALSVIAEKFEAETGIHVNIEYRPEEAVIVSMAGGVVPDITCFRGQLIPDFFDAFAPLPEEASDESDMLIRDIMKPFVYKDGQYYNWPLPRGTSAVMFSNTPLLDEFGIDSRNIPEEIRELHPLLRKTTTYDAAGNRLSYGLGTNGGLAAGLFLADLISGNGGDWAVDGKATFNSPEVLEVVEFYFEMAANGCFEPNAQLSQFPAGKSGFMLWTTNFVDELEDASPGYAFGAHMEPYWNQPSYVLAPSNGLSILANAPNLEGAQEFMRFITRPEIHAELAALMKNVPVSVAAIQHEIYQNFLRTTPWMQPMVQAAAYIVSFADLDVSHYFFTDIRNRYTLPLLRQTVAGQISPAEFVYQVHNGVQVILDDLKK